MIRYISFVVGVAAGALYARERRLRLGVERLGAATLETILDAIDANNPTTGSHVRRVADYALILARAADCDEHTQRSIERVALFHDIGKIDGALTDIINETSGLTPQERRAIMTHPQRGADVLSPLGSFYPDLPEGVLAHHEQWDGRGYPKRLEGRRIPLTARIVAIADTFDVVTHARSYKAAGSIAAGTQVIAEGRETQFDPELVDVFLSQPVLDDIRAAMKKSLAPSRKGGKRKKSGQTQAPDITFRWRTKKLARQRKGR